MMGGPASRGSQPFSAAVCLVAGLALSPQPPTPERQPPQGTATLRGVVVGTDGRPLRQATVIAGDDTGRRFIHENTGSDGRYEFSGLPAGTFTISASKSGYVSLRFGQQRSTDADRRVVVADRQTIERIDFTLPRRPAISGRVLDENGAPIEGAAVTAYRIVGGSDLHQQMLGASGRRSDDAGRFRIHSLDPGSYVVSAAPATTGAFRLPGYAVTFFPSQTHISEAQVITLGSDEDRTGIEIRLTPGGAVKVSGMALDSEQQPFRGSLGLRAAERAGIRQPGQFIRAERDGTFLFPAVAPGQYVLRALGGGRSGAEFAAQFVSVGDDAVSGLTIRTAAGSTAAGRIVFEGAPADIEPFTLRFAFEAVDLDRSPDAVPVRLRDDWTFDAVGLFGSMLLRWTDRSSEWLLKAVRVDGEDVVDTPLSFGRRADSLADVEVVMTNRAAHLTGTVMDTRGRPADACCVVVFAADRSRWTTHSRYVKSARPELSGTFSLRGLPSGEYFAAAVTGIQPDGRTEDWRQPAFLESLLPVAVAATLIEGQTTTVSLKLVTR